MPDRSEAVVTFKVEQGWVLALGVGAGSGPVGAGSELIRPPGELIVGGTRPVIASTPRSGRHVG